jgi:hypothetical protein
MPTAVAGSRALYTAQRKFLADFRGVMQRVADQASGVLLRSAAPDGTIDPRRLEPIQTEIGTLIQRVFVGENLRSPYRNEVEPLAEYPALLNKWYVYSVVSVVKAHRDMMLRLLRDAPDVARWLEQAEPQPVTEIAYQNPLATYDPMHKFVDKRGYTLSRNVWSNGVEARMRVDALLEEGIPAGTSAVALSNQLQAFLLGEHQNWFTSKPYGTSANYPALRLARTEITAAHGRITLAAAKANPFVTFIRWLLSPRHPKRDICDVHAANSPFLLDQVPEYPPHPNCICTLVPEVIANPAGVIQDLRAMMRRGERAPLTPLSFRNMLRALLGAYLYNSAFQEFGELFR